ncbi:MAG: hypothetical protein RSA71_13830 [Eubacterium sp.]
MATHRPGGSDHLRMCGGGFCLLNDREYLVFVGVIYRLWDGGGNMIGGVICRNTQTTI